jgi:hypothetical protein
MRHDDQQIQQQHHSAVESRKSGMDRLSMANNYRQEFEDLIQLSESGGELITDEEEDRLYFLELYARQRVGEELVTEERLDLEDWMREEEEKAAAGSDSNLDTIDEKPAPPTDGSNSLSRSVKPNTPSEGSRGAREVSDDHEDEENSEESSKGSRSTSARIRQSELRPSAFHHEGFGDNEFGEFGSFPSDLGGKNTVEQPPGAFENDGFQDNEFGQSASFFSDWGENNQVKGDEESKSQMHTPSNSMGDENYFDESEASKSQLSASERIAEPNNSHHSAEEFGADFEQPPAAFGNDGFEDNAFGQSESFSSDWGENNQVKGDKESKSQMNTPSNSMGDENGFDESEASDGQSSTSERIAESNNSHHSPPCTGQ